MCWINFSKYSIPGPHQFLEDPPPRSFDAKRVSRWRHKPVRAACQSTEQCALLSLRLRHQAKRVCVVKMAADATIRMLLYVISLIFTCPGESSYRRWLGLHENHGQRCKNRRICLKNREICGEFTANLSRKTSHWQRFSLRKKSLFSLTGKLTAKSAKLSKKCQIMPKSSLSTDFPYKKHQIWLIWHYKVSVSNLEHSAVVILGPMCDVWLFLCQKFMDFYAKVRQIAATHAKRQNSRFPRIPWIRDFGLATRMSRKVDCLVVTTAVSAMVIIRPL